MKYCPRCKWLVFNADVRCPRCGYRFSVKNPFSDSDLSVLVADIARIETTTAARVAAKAKRIQKILCLRTPRDAVIFLWKACKAFERAKDSAVTLTSD